MKDAEILCPLRQRRQNASILEQRCTNLALGYSAPVSFVHAPSLADFITTMVGFEIFGTHTTDAAVSGADPIEARPGFSALLDRIEGNGVRVVLIEDASRFRPRADDAGAEHPGADQSRCSRAHRFGRRSDRHQRPVAVMMRQIAGAFHEYEKARLVAKLKAARERKRAAGIKVEGRRSWSEINPELVHEAKRLRRRTKAGQRSLRGIVAELAKRGYVNERGAMISPSAIASMLVT